MSENILNLYRQYHQLVVLESRISNLYGWTDDTNLLPSAVQRRELDTGRLLEAAGCERPKIWQAWNDLTKLEI